MHDSNEDTFLQDFRVILKHSLQNYKKILKKYFPMNKTTLRLAAFLENINKCFLDTKYMV